MLFILISYNNLPQRVETCVCRCFVIAKKIMENRAWRQEQVHPHRCDLTNLIDDMKQLNLCLE